MSSSKVYQLISLMRVGQWVKNLFVFIPPFFGQNLLAPGIAIKAFGGFVVFCLVASAIYVLNDIFDVKEDRQHPEKKNRPLASGKVGVGEAVALMITLLISAALLVWLYVPAVWPYLALYVVLNLAYSLYLKHLAIIDVVIISVGFILRILVGGAATETFVSDWLILMTFLLALFLGLAKRRGEFNLQSELEGQTTRKSLDGYNLAFINHALVLVAGVTLVCYIMYTVSPEVVARLGSDKVYFSTVFVVVGILRYLQQSFVFDRVESPTRFLFTDHFLQITLFLWGAFFFFLLYF